MYMYARVYARAHALCNVHYLLISPGRPVDKTWYTRAARRFLELFAPRERDSEALSRTSYRRIRDSR